MLYCIECGCCSELGNGWVAMRCDDPHPDQGDSKLRTRRRRQVRLRVGTAAEPDSRRRLATRSAGHNTTGGLWAPFRTRVEWGDPT
jgi:hypothetical protein